MPTREVAPATVSKPSTIHAILVVMTEDGLHMRVASKIVQLASPFQSAIEIQFNGTTANAKSVIDLLTLAAERGSRLQVTATGNDADEAMNHLMAGLPKEDLRPAPAE